MRASNELRRDLLALRRHLWFVILVFLVALAAAAASLFIAPASDEASFRASVSVFSLSPLAEPNTLAMVPTTDDFARLSTSPEALEKTSQALSQQGVNIPPDDLAAKLSARARPGQNAIDFTVKTDDSDLSLQIARAWSQAFAELAPAKAPDLERQATGGYQVQLDRAKTQLEQKRQALTYLGVATLPGETGASPQGQFSALAATYQAKTEALAQREVERSDIQNTLDTLRAAVESGTSSLSTAQLRLLLAGVLPADTDLGPTLTTAQAIAALDLRLTALDSSLAALRQEVQGLEATLNQRSTSVQQATAELQAAEQNYEAASRIAQSYELVAQQLTVSVAVLKAPYAARAGALDWTARLAAAAAFAAVVGVLGALALEQMSRRGSRAAPAAPRPAPRPLSRNPSPPAGVSLTKLRPNTPQPGKRTAWERPMQLGATGLAILLLVGVLGTMNQRQRSRHRREGRGNL